ncbi:hypothetical protein WDZ92_50110 [Nostoc sp. NIES-2111]
MHVAEGDEGAARDVEFSRCVSDRKAEAERRIGRDQACARRSGRCVEGHRSLIRIVEDRATDEAPSVARQLWEPSGAGALRGDNPRSEITPGRRWWHASYYREGCELGVRLAKPDTPSALKRPPPRSADQGWRR